MHSLRSSTGQMLLESAEIQSYAVTFYEQLFKKDFHERPEVAQSFFEGLPKIPVEANGK